jgi:hypothetical protein
LDSWELYASCAIGFLVCKLLQCPGARRDAFGVPPRLRVLQTCHRLHIKHCWASPLFTIHVSRGFLVSRR